MRSVVAYACVLALLFASGCARGADSTGIDEAFEAARPVAEAWSADARLAGVSTLEYDGATNWQEADLPAWDPGPSVDGVLDDGLTRAWQLLYVSMERNASLQVAVGAGGRVLHQEEGPRGPVSVDAALTWSIGPAEAWQLARANATFAAAADAAHVTASAIFLLPGSAPHWGLFAGESLDGRLEAEAWVDATTGRLGTLRDLLRDAWGRPAHIGFGSGSVTALRPSHVETVTIPEAYSNLTVSVETGPASYGALPTTLEVSIYDARGAERLRFTHQVPLAQDAMTAATFEGVPAGNYTLRFDLATTLYPGVTADFRFGWCTDGLVASEAPRFAACEARPGGV